MGVFVYCIILKYRKTKTMNERFVHSELNGSLFKNDYKEKETHPDYKGKVMIGGKEMQIAGWNKEKQDGNTFISVRISIWARYLHGFTHVSGGSTYPISVKIYKVT